jgi:hypothetical protein
VPLACIPAYWVWLSRSCCPSGFSFFGAMYSVFVGFRDFRTLDWYHRERSAQGQCWLNEASSRFNIRDKIPSVGGLFQQNYVVKNDMGKKRIFVFSPFCSQFLNRLALLCGTPAPRRNWVVNGWAGSSGFVPIRVQQCRGRSDEDGDGTVRRRTPMLWVRTRANLLGGRRF